MTAVQLAREALLNMARGYLLAESDLLQAIDRCERDEAWRTLVVTAKNATSNAATLARAVIEAEERAERAARALVTALYLYPHYRLDSRHNAGCVMDALRAVAPAIAAEVVETDARSVYAKHWGQDDDDLDAALAAGEG